MEDLEDREAYFAELEQGYLEEATGQTLRVPGSQDQAWKVSI